MTLERRLGTSVPAYQERHSGPVLVCGNAYCLAEDLDRARRLYPEAPSIAVNGASGNVKAIALFSLHPDKLIGWRGLQEKVFGPGFTVHGVCRADRVPQAQKNMPWVDHWWDSHAKGSSGWAARKIAHYMGFAPVILCGMPLSQGNYQGGKIAKLWRKKEVVSHFRHMVEQDREWHAGVYSMSGWTRDVLGEPS